MRLGHRILRGKLLRQVRLQGILIHPVEDRRHDEHGQKQRHAGEDLVRRRLLQAEGLTQNREDNDDPREAGHQHDERRNEAQRGHDQQNLQTDRIFLLTIGTVGQRDRLDRQRIGRQRSRRYHDQQQQYQETQGAHYFLSLSLPISSIRR